MDKFLTFLITEAVSLHRAEREPLKESSNKAHLEAIEIHSRNEQLKKVIRNLPEKEQKQVTNAVIENLQTHFRA